MGPINNNLASLSSSKIQSQPDYIYSVQSALHSSERVYMQLTERLYTVDKGFTKLRRRVHGGGGGGGGHTFKENSVSRSEKFCSSDGPTVNTRSTDENNQLKQILINILLFKLSQWTHLNAGKWTNIPNSCKRFHDPQDKWATSSMTGRLMRQSISTHLSLTFC